MNAWNEGADQAITHAIAENLDEQAPFITGWVLICTYSGDDGGQSTAFNTLPDQRRTNTLGMLTHALEVERANIFWDEQPD